MKIRPFVIALWLAFAPVLATAAEPAGGEPSPAELPAGSAKNPDEHAAELLAGSARSPEEHRALAAYFDEKAKALKRDANLHHQMELSYSHWFPGQKMAEHCRALMALDKQMAREYGALARAHAAEADK